MPLTCPELLDYCNIIESAADTEFAPLFAPRAASIDANAQPRSKRPPIAGHDRGFEAKNRRYLGCKQRLISFIDESLKNAGVEFDTLLDGFAGTGVVGQHFAAQGKTVYSNDILFSNYAALNAFSGSSRVRKSILDGVIANWSRLAPVSGYFAETYKGKYFSLEVCEQVDAIRKDIDYQAATKRFNKREINYLITALIYAVDRVANTCGHYDAFRTVEPASTSLNARPLQIETYQNCKQFNKDVLDIASQVEVDLAYLDPPYNSRQYSSCYHVLENIALGGGLGVQGKGAKPLLADKKSKWCTNDALDELSRLLDALQARHIAVSYNNMFSKGDGRSAVRIGYEDLFNALQKHGHVQVFETSHTAFSTGKTNISDHKELLFICSR